MFYNQDILSRRKTGLGIVWLAATLGDRSVVRRLTRKDILSVGISRACEYIGAPSEPLALRLSSQLMYGVVKLYGHQMELLYQDVVNTHSDVRRHMLTFDVRGTGTEGIDMRKPTMGVEAITLPLDLAFFTLDLDMASAGLWGRWSVEPPTMRDVQGVVGDGFRTPTPVRFVEEERRITLPRAAFEEEELGLARAYEEAEPVAPFFEEYGVEEEEMEGLDLGLEPVRPEPFIPEALEGVEREAGEETGVTVGPLVEWPELEDRLVEEASRLEIIQGVPTVTPARRPREEEVEEEERLPGRPPAPRPPAFPLEDAFTELTDQQLRTSRADYPARMALERSVQRRRKTRREADATVRGMIYNPPEDLALDPLLSEMWDLTVGADLASRRQRYHQMANEAALLPLDEIPPTPPPPSPIDLSDLVEVGVARAAAEAEAEAELPAALRGVREALPWNVFMQQRRRSSRMPSISIEQPPTFLRETTPLRPPREVSVETPTGLRRLPRAPISPLLPAPATPSTIAPLEEFYQPPPETPSVTGLRLGLPRAPEGVERSPTPPAEVFQQEMQEETRNFFEYAKSVREELEDPNFLFFSDLAPVPSSTPAVAAQAFYHTLALTSAARIKVQQDQAYGEIRITLLT
nr:meiotic cohesin complex subunit [Pseudozyma thailandica]